MTVFQYIAHQILVCHGSANMLLLHHVVSYPVIPTSSGCDDDDDDDAFFLLLIIAVNVVSPRNRTLWMNPVP